jgi:NAD(P)H dehydrogenase (quinone)
MILVTGAGGKTGRAVVKALSRHKEPVCALVRHPEQVPLLTSLGAQQVFIGDMSDPVIMSKIFASMRVVYHICPNMSPNELQIAENAVNAARSAGLEQFVYHSVLHPQIEAMPHHWLKMRVEERLFRSGLAYTILQPGAYMQNILAYWESISRQGVFPVPYDLSARLSYVDLEDIAEVASRVIQQPGHTEAIYELAGPEPLSQSEVAKIIAEISGHPVEARIEDRTEWEKKMHAVNMNPFAVETLLKMFVYYEKNGLIGSPKVLEWLLERPARRFASFVESIVQGA